MSEPAADEPGVSSPIRTSSRMPTVVRPATRRASRIGRRGMVSPDSWSVAVPVMVVGWTMHRNVYPPAGSAGTA
jgi:hypothetical protein